MRAQTLRRTARWRELAPGNAVKAFEAAACRWQTVGQGILAWFSTVDFLLTMRRSFELAMACLLAVFGLPGTGAAVADDDLARLWTRDADNIPYRAFVTPGRSKHELLPLIVFLHGDWQDGADNQAQLAGYGNGSMELIDRAEHGGIPIVYVAPQVASPYWPPARVADVVRDAIARYPIDPRRIYLTGVSDGATGVWDAIKVWPQCFAAGVPMSGMTEITGLAPIVDVPQWIFHGGKDNDTDVETGYGGAMQGSRRVVAALRNMGGKPRYSEYPNEMHVIWHEAYATEQLLPWMLAQRLPGRPCDFSTLHP